MIISHDLRLIFLKTKKTAGTSLELSLSALCGPLDVVTPVTPEDEELREWAPPRNYLRGDAGVRKLRPDGVKVPDKTRDFYNHMPAAQVRDYVGARLWKRYLKVAFVRNPWDIEVSRHFFKAGIGKRSIQDTGTKSADIVGFREALAREGEALSSEWDIVAIGDDLAVDFVGRYETLEADYHRLLGELGAKGAPPLARAKTAQRPESARDYRAFYDDAARDLVARAWSREIATFGYAFQASVPSEGPD